MVEIKKIGNDKIKIDEIEISIKDYNDPGYGWYKNDEWSIKKEYEKLAKEIHISLSKENPKTGTYYTTEEYHKELEKIKKVNWSGYQESENIQKQIDKLSKSFHRIWSKSVGDPSDDDENKIKSHVTFNNERVKEHLELYQKALPILRQLYTQKKDTGNGEWGGDYNNPNKDKTREELGQRANEIEAYRKKVKGEIEAELNKKPKITNEDLESGNKGWESEIWRTIIALGEKEIDDIKDRVIADIQVKRVAKQESDKKPLAGQELKNFARDAIYEIDTERNRDENTDLFVTWEELEINNPDWRKKITDAAEAGNEKEVRHIKVKVLVDLRFEKAQKKKGEDAWEKVKNGSVGEMNESQLAAAIQNFEKKEGDKGYKRDDKYQFAEDELIAKDPELYKKIVIEALRKRLKNNGLSEEEFSKLSQDYLKLVNKEITEIEEFKRIKNELGEKIGKKGAESKWNSLFNRAKTLLEKAKRQVTQQVKKDLKTIQEQMKNFKSEDNAYLNSYYKVNKNKVDKLEKNLSDYSTDQTGSPKKTPWGIIIPVSLVVVTLIGMVAVVIVRRRKQNRIKK